MMNQQKTKKAGILKYSLIVPLALALVLSSNAETVVNNAKSNSKTTVETPTETKTTEVSVQQTTKSNVKFTPPVIQKQKAETEKIYDVVEKMPQFPGGESELLNYIGKSVKYPTDAQAKGIEGRIIARFIVNKEGKVEKAEIIRSLNPECDKEALRVINSMPQFTPGEQNGKKVSVYYTLPFIFKLASDSKSTVKKENATSGIKESFKITDGTKPLYIIDGKYATEAEFKALKPENIKEVNVLKGGTATAIYGSRGADGVVVITMKK